MVLSQAHGKPSNTNTDAIHVQDDAIKPTCANDEEKNEELDVDNDSKPAALPIIANVSLSVHSTANASTGTVTAMATTHYFNFSSQGQGQILGHTNLTTAESYFGDKLSANTDDSNEEANENENIEVEREEERGDEFKNFLETLHLDGAR
jgi:hypothetical protein